MGHATQHSCISDGIQPLNVAKAERTGEGILQPLSSPDHQSPTKPNQQRTWERHPAVWASCDTEQREGQRVNLEWRNKSKVSSTMIQGIAPESIQLRDAYFRGTWLKISFPSLQGALQFSIMNNQDSDSFLLGHSGRSA